MLRRSAWWEPSMQWAATWRSSLARASRRTNLKKHSGLGGGRRERPCLPPQKSFRAAAAVQKDRVIRGQGLRGSSLRRVWRSGRAAGALETWPTDDEISNLIIRRNAAGCASTEQNLET